MLINLSISNVVLISRLNLEFGAGLNILTGETGAGKSILLDALSLALGARGDAGLVRAGTDSAAVVAEFDVTPVAARDIMAENGIDVADTLILRRTLTTDGKSRAWVNDTPVSVKTLKQIGDALVEIHGQFANHAMLDAATHRATLDSFAAAHHAGFADIAARVRATYKDLSGAQTRLRELQETLSRAETEREFLEHNVAELRALNPQRGEEDDLATRRAAMMNAEKDAAILQDAIDALAPHGTSLDAMVFSVAHILQRVKTDPNPYEAQIDKLYQIAEDISDVAAALAPADVDVSSLEEVEERLFAIRAASRKHRVSADELPDKLEQMAAQLNAIDNSDAEIKKLTVAVAQYRAAFDAAARELSAARRAAAENMRDALLRELPDLKLGGADFRVDIAQSDPTANGTDDVVFMIKMNPGAPFAPLHKSASGGELARLMLALRVVLAGDNDAHTFVFDEVDTGISGATSAAVGLRLNKLAATGQALVITHSAQVAGYADRHFKIQKTVTDGVTTTGVSEITGDARLGEVARIISGAEITPEALATARTLMKK